MTTHRRSVITGIVLLLTIGVGGTIHAQPYARLDPVLRMLLSTPASQRHAFAPSFKFTTPSEDVGVILECDGDAATLRAAGARVQTHLGGNLADYYEKVYRPGLTKPTSGKFYAIVTGICTIEMDGSTLRLRLRPRKQSDLLYY